MPTRRIVRAAGGLVTRHDQRGLLEVLLVHRPHNQDWTFPKGKVEPGETDEACAAREVEEETGLRCRLGRELPHTSYTAKGRPKHVRYWLMHPEEGGVAEPRNEVDAVRWLPLAEAPRTLTYERDRALLEGFRASLDGASRPEPTDAERGGPT